MGRGRPKSIRPKYITSVSIPLDLKPQIDATGKGIAELVEMGLLLGSKIKEYETALSNSEKIREVLQSQILALSDELAKFQLGLNNGDKETSV